MDNQKEDKNKIRQMHIDSALSFWGDKLKGINRWYDNTKYSHEYCKEQIEYFNNFKWN